MSEGIVVVSVCGMDAMNKALIQEQLCKEIPGQQVVFEERAPMELSLHCFDYHLPEDPFYPKKFKARRRGQRKTTWRRKK